eukprot:2226-Heterococcus_DN1.PRE.1
MLMLTSTIVSVSSTAFGASLVDDFESLPPIDLQQLHQQNCCQNKRINRCAIATRIYVALLCGFQCKGAIYLNDFLVSGSATISSKRTVDAMGQHIRSCNPTCKCCCTTSCEQPKARPEPAEHGARTSQTNHISNRRVDG